MTGGKDSRKHNYTNDTLVQADLMVIEILMLLMPPKVSSESIQTEIYLPVLCAV